MLMIHFEEPKLSDEEEPPTEQDKRKKLVSQTCQTHAHTHSVQVCFFFLWDVILAFFSARQIF